MASSSRDSTPIDHGYAWVVLLGCSLMRMLAEGFCSALGVLFVKWQIFFNASASSIAWIGFAFMLISFSSAPIASAVAHKLTYRVVVIGGGILTFTALLGASQVNELWHVYLIMSLCGLGIGVAQQTSRIFFVYYFNKHFAFANGLNASSSGMGYIIGPLLEYLISKYGWSGALLVMSALMANISVCGALLRPSDLEIFQIRESRSRKSEKAQRLNDGNAGNRRPNRWCYDVAQTISESLDLSLFCKIRFLFQGILNGFLYGWNYIVLLYLVPYCVEAGISPFKSSLLVTVIGVSQLFVRLMPIGCLVDKNIISASTIGGIGAILGGVIVLAIPFTKEYSMLVIISVGFGMTLLGITGSLYPVVVRYSAGSTEKAPGAAAWIMVQNGMGCVTGILFTGFLHDLTGSYTVSYLLTGVCFMCMGVSMLADQYIIRLQSRFDQRKNRQPYSNP